MNKGFVLIILLFTVASCRSSKTTKLVYTKAPKSDVLIEAVQTAHFNFNWMSAKISGKYSAPNQSFSFKGNLKIRKDSLIWMSISPGLGLELGRVLFAYDSIHFMNRFEKTYYKSSYAELSKKTQSPLSFMRIQALLIGNAMNDFDSKKHDSWLADQMFRLSLVSEKQLKKWQRSKRKPDQEIYLATIQPERYKIMSQEYKNLKLNRNLVVTYDDFEEHNDLLFGESIDLRILTSEEIKLSISFSKINIDKRFKFPFTVPDSYEIID